MFFFSFPATTLLTWGAAGLIGVLLLADGLYSALAPVPLHYSLFYNKHMVFGLILAGVLLILISLPPLHSYFRESTVGGKRSLPPLAPLPPQFAEVVARAGEGGGEQSRQGSAHPTLPPLSLDAAIHILGADVSHGLYSVEARARLLQCGPNEVSTSDAPSYLSIFLKELYEGPQLLLVVVGVAYALVGAGQAVPADVFLLSASSLEIDEAAVTGESIPNPKRVGVRAGRGRGGEEGGGGGGGGGEGEETGSSVLSVVVMGEGEGGGKGEGQEREGKE
ncbi:hypothetical protein NGA_0429700, partial [Nannochloropsis gaditana CCMP526]|uniref:uncharacterized protein n=1 Tax=Nannochloropsis gaditana (strain CCMP526) TaxID=1093141 RepID=UPI00029F627F